MIILLIAVSQGAYLYSLPSYNRMWRPDIHVNAKYEIHSEEATLKIVGSENFRNVKIVTDSLEEVYSGRFHKKELSADFQAEWFMVAGGEDIVQGEKDTLSLDWQITSERPWYRVSMNLTSDSLAIAHFESDLKFNHKEDCVRITWFADPPDALDVNARLVLEPGAELIRKITATYPEMPVPITVTSDMTNIRYRTTVVRVDTLAFVD